MRRACRLPRMWFKSRVSRMSLGQLTGRTRTRFTGDQPHKRQLNTKRRCKTAFEIAPPAKQPRGATVLDPVERGVTQQ
jgi:hypothetical protein